MTAPILRDALPATSDLACAARQLPGAHEPFGVAHLTGPGVRPLVADSWLRSATAGVSADGSRLPPLRMMPDELAEYRRGHPLAAVLPLFRELLGDTAADDGHIFAVGDADGTLLWVQGDRAVLRRAEQMHFVEGAVWTEEQAGTNAPGTALATGRPVQILGIEHYSPVVRHWSCAAAPIRDPADGRVLGFVDVTGGGDIGKPLALAAVRATARAAEGELARATARMPRTPGGGIRLAALGRDCAVLEADGRTHRLSPRHSEIAVALALTAGGATGERLAVELSEQELHPSTVRAEMTRLRAALGPDLLGSRPYTLLRPVSPDFRAVRDLLARGRTAEAMARYAGPLLPSSLAPVVVEYRRALEQQLRDAVLASGDPALLRRWVDSAWGAGDARAWRTLADRLPGGSAQRAAAAGRARALDRELCAAPQAGAVAALLQRRRP